MELAKRDVDENSLSDLRAGLKRNGGLTSFEVLLIIVVLAILAILLLPAHVGDGRKAARTVCASNLKQIAMAHLAWATDNSSAFPMRLSTNENGTLELLSQGDLAAHFKALSNELESPMILACPSDRRKPTRDFNKLGTSAISYFVSLDASTNRPRDVLVGDRNLTNRSRAYSRVLLIDSNDTLDWTTELHNKKRARPFVGNKAFADCSVGTVTARADLEDTFRVSGSGTNCLVFP